MSATAKPADDSWRSIPGLNPNDQQRVMDLDRYAKAARLLNLFALPDTCFGQGCLSLVVAISIIWI